MKKILLIGNHSCANRGDAAILRGLLAALGEKNVEIYVASRDPDSCKIVLGLDEASVIDDVLFQARQEITEGGLFNRLFFSKYLNGLMYLSSSFDWPEKLTLSLLPKQYKKAVKTFDKYDQIIQVGGSFIVDSYGFSQLDIIFASKLAAKKISLIGHSLGPFDHPQFRGACKKLLKYPSKIFLREQISKTILEEAGIELNNLHDGSDTAWLMPEAEPYELNNDDYLIHRPLIAITARKLAPFDKVLGVSQEAYEKRLAKVCDSLISQGYGIIGLSTCTGLNSYRRDDRITLNNIKNRIKGKEYFKIIFDELTDLQLGSVIKKCELMLATRLHSGIIAMRYNIPALVIAYEHKSLGILNDMELSELSSTMQDFLTADFEEKLYGILSNKSHIQEKLKTRVDLARQKARLQIEEVVS